MKRRVLHVLLISVLLLVITSTLGAQSLLQGGNNETIKEDTTISEQPQYYRTGEISYEIESINRYIETSEKQLDTYHEISEIDTSFSHLSARIQKEFEEFNSFNKINLSKFFLLNTKRVWLSYKSQLTSWQVNISGRISELMQISDKIKEKEQMWVTTSSQPGSRRLPKEINDRILKSINDLNQLSDKLFEVVGDLSVMDSKITDQIIEVDRQIAVIDDLHKSYRSNLFKATQPSLWDMKFKGSYEGSVPARLQKAWYENTKSFRDSLPSFREDIINYIFWILLIILVIIGFRHLYFKRKPDKSKVKENDINELILRHPLVTIIYMVLFVFALMFNNMPLSLSGILSILLLVITYFLLSPYISFHGRRLILIFVILSVANTVEIIFWYFGSIARLYLLLEAVLGMFLVYRFLELSFKKKILPGFRYKRIVKVLRYPIFLIYAIAFVVNIFGFQNITVLFLKIATQVSVIIIIILGAWEISRSFIFTFFEVLKGLQKQKSNPQLPLLKTRTAWLINLFFALVWLRSFLVIIELDTPFYEGLDSLMHTDRHVGSFVFTYNAIFQFVLIMLITWGITTIIRFIFNEGNFKKTQRLRGVPSAISTTLRIIVSLAGFLLALSVAGIDLTKISILIGAFGVGIGFGLQNIVNNFISGLILIYERPIQVGDTIEINSLLGEVKSIGIRSSNVRTYEGAEVIVPNSVLVSDQLINWTLSDDKRRIEVVVGVKYGTDPGTVIQILKQVADAHPLVAKDPEPRVLFTEFADSSLNFRLLCWVLFENGIQTKSDLSVAVDHAFKENGIEIPFPQLDLHVIDNPGERRKKSSPAKEK